MPPYARLQDEDEAPPPPPPPPPPEEELPSDASISVRLAHESARELEMRGRFQLAAEVLARALADEAQRINQGTLHNLDLTDETAAYQSRSVYHAMQAQRAHVQALHRRRLRHASPWQKRSGPALLQCCIAGVARGAGDEMPTPRRTLEDLASRWHLPPAQVEELWREFVEAREALPRGEGWTVACDLPNTCPAGRAKATVLRHVAPEVQQATWSLVLLDAAANDLGWAAYVLDVVPHEPRGIRHKELFSALRDWSELRQLFSAREPSEALREAAPRAGEWTKNVFDLFRR
ncbi:hypothetical protein EMIHUDRAFT_452236 [Emiliania huxleyi CCMP1516]|uniref:Uncharacterized protein n=2 Tax=Emiliania huxleyi TaxID=2903 RepID=A0A0D3IMJ3_EMIH1|nr:hypothetical protein EMIHUDRAFT_452236 [Emiliania huxleyi CCMP1516]EOD12478.1 hypothetical protein EMIHUDRAFT_452236 [Emiliania huxleyi CCMP1516]|eukprot:XP_005764907.1 hypothetical protein EMIHUDRAFT_452236 [Emiliania huxleyi CCMP1516]